MAARGMQEHEKLSMGIAVYAVSRTTTQARSCDQPPVAESLLRLHAKEALRGSQARKDLRPAE